MKSKSPVSRPLYPLVFNPIFKEKIWGGDLLYKSLNKACDPTVLIGESWEISNISGSNSIIKNGYLKGQHLGQICSLFKERLLGKSVHVKFGEDFPLLVKFIDARDDLSVQVHPNDSVAKKKHAGFGKAEMWYILDADPNAQIIYGFNSSLSDDEIKSVIQNNKSQEYLRHLNVHEDEAYYIEPGTVHAIGKGILLAEIQQSSDITYRIYDYNRTTSDGKQRSLHIEESMQVVKNNPLHQFFSSNKSKENIFKTNYFVTNKLCLKNEEKRINYDEIDSFVIYTIIKGEVLIRTSDLYELRLQKGEVVLIPNEINQLTVTTSSGACILETYLPN